MKKKLLAVKADVWFNISNRPDKKEIVAALNELISEKSRFVFSDDMTKFKRLSSSLFDVADQPGFEIKTRELSYGKKCEDLYFEGRLVAIR